MPLRSAALLVGLLLALGGGLDGCTRQEAPLTLVFTPSRDPTALKEMHKGHNMMVPILEGIETLNSYGMEVVSGIILGLDTDSADTAVRMSRAEIVNEVKTSGLRGRGGAGRSRSPSRCSRTRRIR